MKAREEETKETIECIGLKQPTNEGTKTDRRNKQTNEEVSAVVPNQSSVARKVKQKVAKVQQKVGKKVVKQCIFSKLGFYRL